MGVGWEGWGGGVLLALWGRAGGRGRQRAPLLELNWGYRPHSASQQFSFLPVVRQLPLPSTLSVALCVSLRPANALPLGWAGASRLAVPVSGQRAVTVLCFN